MPVNIFSVIKEETAGMRDRTAIVDGVHGLSYGELISSAESVAGELVKAGAGPLCRVGLVCGNSADYIIVSLAVLSTGAALVPVSPEHAAPEVAAIMEEMAADLVVFRRTEYDAEGAADLAPGMPLRASFRILRRSVNLPSPPGYAEIAPAFIRFSSGTTGASKGIVLSHRAIIERTDAADRGLGITCDDRVLWVLSMSFHFVVTILLFLRRGAAIVLCGEPFLETMAAGMEKHGGTLVYAAPFHYAMMTASELLPGGALARVRMAVSTTVKLPVEVAEGFRAKYGLPLTEAYGIIEVGLPFMNVAGVRPGSSVGRPLPGYRVRIADPDAAGTGEICIAGPGMLDAYLSPWRTREGIMEDGWFRTGDLGTVDGEGFLYIVGRRKNVVNFAGMKVFPAEVEEVINRFPGVLESVVYGEEHPRFGSLPMARIVAATKDLDLEDLRRFCYERLATYKVPKGFELVKDIPKTKSGKIRRF
jgi:long-chain acyl-CoA synthetase